MPSFRLLPFALIVVLTSGAAARADDLMQIYQEARQSDPVLASAEAMRNATEENVVQARAALLPQVSGSYGYNRVHGGVAGTQIVTGADGSPTLVQASSPTASRSRSVQGLLNQSLVNVGQWTALKSSKFTARAGDAAFDSAQQDLLIRTAQAYFSVLTALDALKFAQANEKALGRQLEQAQQRFDVGLNAITDVNSAKAQHDAAVASVITNRNIVDQTREAVRILTDREPGDFKRLRDDVPLNHPDPDDPNAWVELALKQNPTLSSFALQADAADTDVTTARAGHLPTLDAQILYSKTPSWGTADDPVLGSYRDDSERWSTTIGVMLNVPIFTGGLTQSRVRQAIFTRDNARDQYELQRRQIVTATRNGFRTVIADASEVEATRASVTSAQSALDAMQAGYEVGTQTIVDVLLAQQTLLQAQSAYSQARHGFVIDGLLLKQAAGSVAVKDLEAINALLE